MTETLEEGVNAQHASGLVGAFVADVLPAARRIPAWFPYALL